MDWGSVIAGALGGGAKAAGDIAQGHIDNQRKLDLAREMATLEEQKAIAAEQRREAAHIRESERTTRAARDQAVWNETDPTLNAGRQSRRAAELEAETKARLAEKQGLLDMETKALQDPNRLKAEVERERQLAQARKVESEQSLAAAAGQRLANQNAQQFQTLRQQLADAKTDTERQAIQQRITDLAFSGKDTAAAYKAYTSATNRITELEIKAAGLTDEAAKKPILAEIQEQRAMVSQAARDLGVKIKDAPAGPPQGAIDMLKKNPQLAAAFESKYPGFKASQFLGDAAKPGAPAPAQKGAIDGEMGPTMPIDEQVKRAQQMKGPSPADRDRMAQMAAAREKAAADPELQALDQRRAAALRAGKASEANNAIAQFNRLRLERYGF